ncbi:putative isochorismatase [Septoria linicola]|nr:putative isochorismatase [Septoria linicola]
MSDAGLFYKKARVLDVWLQGDERGYDEPLPGLEPVEGEHMILKKHASAFFGTEPNGLLHLLEVDTLVVCGVSTSGCVRATVLDALQHKF